MRQNAGAARLGGEVGSREKLEDRISQPDWDAVIQGTPFEKYCILLKFFRWDTKSMD